MTTLQTLQHPINSSATARTMNANLLLPASSLFSLSHPKRQALHFADGITCHISLMGWNIVIQNYDIAAPIPEAAHGLSIFYSGMIQLALQVSTAIPREGPSLGTYNLWVGGVTIEWYALDGDVPWELMLIVGGKLLEFTRIGWAGTWTTQYMRARIVVLVRFVATALVIVIDASRFFFHP